MNFRECSAFVNVVVARLGIVLGIACLMPVCLCGQISDADDSVHVQVIFGNNPYLAAGIVYDTASFSTYLKQAEIAVDRLRQLIMSQRMPRAGFVTLVTHSGKETFVPSYFDPPLTDSLVSEVGKCTVGLAAPKTSAKCDAIAFIFRYKLTRQEADERLRRFLPEIDRWCHPGLYSDSLKEVVSELQRWAREEVLPALAQVGERVDTVFQGVRQLGRNVRGMLTNGSVDVNQLTERNPAFWRALMEMAPDDPLASATQIFLHVASGHFDHIRTLNQIIVEHSDSTNAAAWYLRKLRRHLGGLNQVLNERVSLGIAEHDQGNFDSALVIYDAILSDYPGSAWTRYERFFTLMTKDGTAIEDWPVHRDGILAANPLYSRLSIARTGREAYNLGCRMELDELFQGKNRVPLDLLRYADIAYDLEQYGTAAQIYWLLRTYYRPAIFENRDLLDLFVCSLRHLDQRETEQYFTKNFDSACAAITAERRKLMEESPAYRSMQTKE